MRRIQVIVIFIFILSSLFLLFYRQRLPQLVTFIDIRTSLLNNIRTDRSTNPTNSTAAIIERLTFERWPLCSVDSREPCFQTNKSIVLSFWSERSKSRWLSANILSAFPSHSFDHLIFVYDNSSWTSHPGHDQFIFIHVRSQIRFWYVKRFFPPSLIESYEYVWIIDDDSKLNFKPSQYQCVLRRLNISLSAPGRLSGALSHQITKQNLAYVHRTGRWTDTIETGPTFVALSSAWSCIYQYLDAYTGSGWGLDLIWCNMLADVCFPWKNRERICAILDAFTIDHQSTQVASGGYGAPESPNYTNKYEKWIWKSQNYGALTNNRTILDSCGVVG